ncbi:MAG: anhydro-N-acetylmuramic acid kinase [Rickettsiales bacterium]
MQPIWALGLMSGTSLDGVDAALIKTDGENVLEFGAALTLPLPRDLIGALQELMMGDEADWLIIERRLTLLHAEAVKKVLAKANMSAGDVGILGFHGQTITHRPRDGITWQMGNPALLAEETGISVVADFRRADVAAGGEGAPLVPLYHAALAQTLETPIAILNIGGIANITWIGSDGSLIAFDTGPGNAMLNDWMRKRTGMLFDRDGKIAEAGKLANALIEEYLQHPYFEQLPPKSLDRNEFSLEIIKHLSTEDGAATLTRLTAEAVYKSLVHLPERPRRWLITGGGRHNPTMMAALRSLLEHVTSVENVGWRGDFLEAEAFAFLAVRSMRRMPLTLPSTTGANRAVTGGAFYSH